MNTIVSSVAHLLVNSSAAVLAVPARRVAIKTTAGILTSVFLLAAVGCAAAALWISAIPQLGHAGAAAAVSGLFVLLSVLVIAIAAWLLRGTKPSRVLPPSQTLPLVEASQLFRYNKGAVIVGAIVAGMLVAEGRRRH